MTFREFLQFEQGTVGGPMGGPTASGRLGQSPAKPEGPITSLPSPSPMSPRGMGTKQPDKPEVKASNMLPGTKPQVQMVKGPLQGGALGGGGSKGPYMNKKMKKK